MRTLLILFSLSFGNMNITGQILAGYDYAAEGHKICLVESEYLENTKQIKLKFLDASLNNAHTFKVYRRPLYGKSIDWIEVSPDLTPGTQEWIDTDVEEGDVLEYQVKRSIGDQIAIGYTLGAANYDQSNYKGEMILLVAADMATNLPQEIFQLKQNLTGDGWFVNELIVSPGDEFFNDGAVVVEVKSKINEIYTNAPENDKPKVLFILGQVPLPRSGQGLQAPDGHIEASGARGSDTYYADLDGIFTDTATYSIPEQSNEITRNFPGDYRFDQDKIPSDLELAFGRVSFKRAFSNNFNDEVSKTRLYLEKLHNHRHVVDSEKIPNQVAFYESGYSNSTDASYRCLPAMVGADNIVASGVQTEAGHNQWVNTNGPFLWYMQNRFVPQPDEWDQLGMDALVFSSDQSNWGYGDIPTPGNTTGWATNMIRKTLGYSGKTLITLWTTSGINVFHQVGCGEPLGLVCKEVMDHDLDNQRLEKVEAPWDDTNWWNRTHFNFFGDPTLRLFQCRPPSNLTANTDSGAFQLVWDPSTDDQLLGYHVYKSSDQFGKFTKLTDQILIDNNFVDEEYNVGDWYMVRAVSRITSGSGAFIHPSQGVFIEGTLEVSSSLETELDLIGIYPNPVENFLHLSQLQNVHAIEIFDINQKLLQKIHVNDNQNKLRINVSAYPSGSYELKIFKSKGSQFQRFIKL